MSVGVGRAYSSGWEVEDGRVSQRAGWVGERRSFGGICRWSGVCGGFWKAGWEHRILRVVRYVPKCVIRGDLL